MIDCGVGGGGLMAFGEYAVGSFMISRPTFSYSDWLELVYTNVAMTSFPMPTFTNIVENLKKLLWKKTELSISNIGDFSLC